MPVAEEINPTGAYSTPKDKSIPLSRQGEHKVSTPVFLLGTVGSAAGLAFLGGTIVGPLGALGGSAVGLLLGFVLRKSQRG